MPSLDEVLEALPDRIFLIHQKDTSLQTSRRLGAILNQLSPGRRSRIFYLGNAGNFAELQRVTPEAKRPFASAAEIKRCGKALMLRMGFGALPDACLLNGIALPARYLWLVPGWPNAFLQKTAASGVPVYVTEVDTREDLEKLYPLPIHGILTDRIEIVGPMLSPVD
jgi:glycerophosphoryl diester phosphodiesterase